MKNRCLFSIEAIGSILVECYRNGTSCETGGILVGPKGHSNIVTHVIPSTSHAERQYAMYRQTPEDVAILNRQLRKLHKQGYIYVGEFHRHPRGLKTLSQGDINTCRDIFADPDYVVNGQLIMGIVTEGTEDLPVYIYKVIQGYSKITVERVEIEVMPLRCIEQYISFNQINFKGENDHEKDSYSRQGN